MLEKRHNPASVREWNNSVYAYNSKRTMLLPAIDKIVIKLIKSYFNAWVFWGPRLSQPFGGTPPVAWGENNNPVYSMNQKSGLSISQLKRWAWKRIKFSVQRMNISKLELKHTNSKVVIVVYVYSAILQLGKKKRHSWRELSICQELGLMKESKSISQRVKFLEKNLKLLYEELYKDLHTEDEDEEENLNLVEHLAKYYNKEVELKVIRLHKMELNAKILAERLALELNQGIRSPLRTIRNALKRVKTPKVNKKLYYFTKENFLKKYSALYNNISTLNVESLGISNIGVTPPVVNDSQEKTLIDQRNEVIMSTKHKVLTGVKIQIAGRLTRRATAAKAVTKGGQVGGLKNLESSTLGLSVGLLRGWQRANINKAYFNHRTKNGSFNVKVWTSSF